jgi:hypothetical protein
MNMETCYMCDRPRTTREHVPPQCFFPEQKDLPEGVDYRRNLIQVPSCDEHNLHSSEDDEYLLVIIAAHYLNNQAAYSHYMTKIIRTFRHSGGLRQRFFESCFPATLNGEPTVAIVPETDRLLSELDKIARGIHYRHFGQKWLAPSLWIFSPSRLRSTGSFYDHLSLRICTEAENQIGDTPQYGDNPDIFYYQAYRDDLLTMLKIVFYCGFEVFVLDVPQLGHAGFVGEAP